MRERAMKQQVDGRKKILASEAEVKLLQAQLEVEEAKILQLQSQLAQKPAANPNPPVAAPAVPAIPPVFYGLSNSKLVREYSRVLTALQAELTANPRALFRLTGHSNLEGDESVNLRQSAVRAELLAKFLT